MAMRQILVVLWALVMCLYQAESKRGSVSRHLPSNHPESERDDDDKPESEASLLEEKKTCYKHLDCPMCYLCTEHDTFKQGHCFLSEGYKNLKICQEYFAD